MTDKNNYENSPVLGLSHLLLQVTDLQLAEDFYLGILGLEVRSRGTFGGNRPLISTRQGLGITLLPEGPVPIEKRNLEHVAFWVSNIQILADTLKAAGYTVDGPKRNEYGTSLSVRDPDGNRIECIEQD